MGAEEVRCRQAAAASVNDGLPHATAGGGEGRASHAADLDGARVESDVTSSAHSCHRPQAAGPSQATE